MMTLGDCALLLLRPRPFVGQKSWLRPMGGELRRSFRSEKVMMGEKTPAQALNGPPWLFKQVLRLPHQITGEQKELVEDCRLDMAGSSSKRSKD